MNLGISHLLRVFHFVNLCHAYAKLQPAVLTTKALAPQCETNDALLAFQRLHGFVQSWIQEMHLNDINVTLKITQSDINRAKQEPTLESLESHN